MPRRNVETTPSEPRGPQLFYALVSQAKDDTVLEECTGFKCYMLLRSLRKTSRFDLVAAVHVNICTYYHTCQFSPIPVHV